MLYSSSFTRLDVVNYVLAYLGMREVDSSFDTTHSRLVYNELVKAMNLLSHESDWQDITKNMFLSELDRVVQYEVCGGAIQHQFSGNVVRVDSVWDVANSKSLPYLDYDRVQAQPECGYVYVSADIDFITADNDFTYFYEAEQVSRWYTFVNNSIVLFPNVTNVDAIKASVVTRATVPAKDSMKFELSDEIVLLLQAKTLCLVSVALRPELYQTLELNYREAVSLTRQRLNYYPTKARRSVL